MTKKSENTTQTGGAGTDPTQAKLNELYTAHQVHTLAQLIYQQLAARRSGGTSWSPATTTGMASPMNGQSFTNGWTGNPVQGAPQPRFYWYS